MENNLNAGRIGLGTATNNLEVAVYKLRSYVRYGSNPGQLESVDIDIKKTVNESVSAIERISRRLMDVTKMIEEIQGNINLE